MIILVPTVLWWTLLYFFFKKNVSFKKKYIYIFLAWSQHTTSVIISSKKNNPVCFFRDYTHVYISIVEWSLFYIRFSFVFCNPQCCPEVTQKMLGGRGDTGFDLWHVIREAWSSNQWDVCSAGLKSMSGSAREQGILWRGGNALLHMAIIKYLDWLNSKFSVTLKVSCGALFNAAVMIEKVSSVCNQMNPLSLRGGTELHHHHVQWILILSKRAIKNCQKKIKSSLQIFSIASRSNESKMKIWIENKKVILIFSLKQINL